MIRPFGVASQRGYVARRNGYGSDRKFVDRMYAKRFPQAVDGSRVFVLVTPYELRRLRYLASAGAKS